MKKTNLVLGAGLLAIAFAVVACGTKDLDAQQSTIAELGAVKYAQAFGGTYLSCSGQDSNQDGYVTCTVKDAQQQATELACSYKSAGCKLK